MVDLSIDRPLKLKEAVKIAIDLGVEGDDLKALVDGFEHRIENGDLKWKCYGDLDIQKFKFHGMEEAPMSIVRFAWNGSDVYVYYGSGGITCCGCRLSNQGFVCEEPEDMILHLAEHRRKGHFVPEGAILALWEDIPGAQKPSRGEPDELTGSALLLDKIQIELEIERLEKRLKKKGKNP